MGEAMRGGAGRCRGGRRTLAVLVGILAAVLGRRGIDAQEPRRQLESGRYTIRYAVQDERLAASIGRAAVERDSFPGLPRAQTPVLVDIAASPEEFRDMTRGAPAWGIAIAIPEERRIVVQGRRAESSAGDPLVSLRHELAHLALHDFLGDAPPRWFDEGYASYAAGEWNRDDAMTLQLALVMRRVPSLDSLNGAFAAGRDGASAAYALATRAVLEMVALDPRNGLTLLFQYWRETGRLDLAVRRAYGTTYPAFETAFVNATRRRYGALAFLADLTVATTLLMIIVAPFYVSRRRRDRERLAALRAADAAEAARAAADPLMRLLDEPTASVVPPAGEVSIDETSGEPRPLRDGPRGESA